MEGNLAVGVVTEKVVGEVWSMVMRVSSCSRLP